MVCTLPEHVLLALVCVGKVLGVLVQAEGEQAPLHHLQVGQVFFSETLIALSPSGPSIERY